MPVYQKKNKDGKILKDTKGNSWYYKCYYTDVYGNRKQRLSKLYKLSKDAKEAERMFLEEANKGIGNTIVSDKNIDFIQVYNEWLLYKKAKVKSTTFYSVVKRSECHIVPFFREYKLFAIRINVVNSWKNEILNLDMTMGHKNTLIRTLKEILIYARDYYNFSNQIVTTLQLYKIENVIQKTDAETNFWTYDEFKKFIKVVDNELYFVIFNFLYFTGLRIGEMIALTWEDLDFNKKSIKVNKTYTDKVLEGSNRITTPKTTNSIRYVDLDDNLLQLLLKHKEKEKKIYNFKEDMFIFGNVKYISPTSLKRYLYKYIKLADVKKITPHGFRHSHISLLINIGCDSRDVANRVGDTIQMIEKTYYHMFPEKKKNTVNLLNNLKK